MTPSLQADPATWRDYLAALPPDERLRQEPAAHLRLGIKLARKYFPRLARELPTDELESEVLLALCQATRTYRPDYSSPRTGRPVKFVTFAGHHVIQQLRRVQFLRDRKRNRGMRQLPDGIDVAAAAGPDAASEAAAKIRALLDRLHPADRYLVMQRFGLLPGQRVPSTYAEIGFRIGKSAEWVRRLVRASMQQLRTLSEVSA